MATVVNIISRCGLDIDVCCTNQPNKSNKLALYKPLIHIYSSCKCVTNRYTSVIKVSVVCVDIIYISMCLKEELVWTTDKWPSYTTKELKNKAILNLNQYCMCCYVVLSNV